MKDNDIIKIIAEQLVNMFPGQIIHNLDDKAERLYRIMRLKEPIAEIENVKKVMMKLIKEL